MDALASFFILVISVFLVIVISILVYLLGKTNKEKEKYQQKLNQLRGKVLELARRESMELLENWRRSELDNLRAEIRKNLQESIDSEYKVNFDNWKKEFEKTIRKDAASKSRSTLIGKITEHFIPYLPKFAYDPQDARFLGAPIDFIVFDGLSEGAIREIVFVEVKTNKGSLSKRERQLRDAIKEHRVSWIEIRRKMELDAPTEGEK